MSLQHFNGMTLSVAAVGLVGGTTTTYTTTAATAGFIDGEFGTALAAQTNTATPTTDADTGAAFVALAASEACVFVFGVTAAGAIAVQQGPVVSMDSDTNEPDFYLEFPAVIDTVLPVGYGVIKNGSTGSAWTFGASNWTATGVIDTFSDVGVLPDRPVSA